MVLTPASTNGYDTSDKTETKTEKMIHNIFRIPEELEFTRVAQFPVRPILWNQIPSNNTISSAMKRANSSKTFCCSAWSRKLKLMFTF